MAKPTADNYNDQEEQLEKVPTLGVFIGKLNDEYDSLMWRSILGASREQQFNTVSFVTTSLTDFVSSDILDFVQADLVSSAYLDCMVVQTGVLVSRYSNQRTAELIRSFSGYMPAVSISVSAYGEPVCTTENYNSVKRMMEHLIRDHQRRRIAFLRGPKTHVEAERRFQAYLDTLTAHQIPIDNRLIAQGDLFKGGGKRAIRDLLARESIEFDAIVAANDTVAKVTMEELAARGIRVPEDVAVVGYDDVLDAQYVTPSLTTIKQPLAQMASAAISQVHQLLVHGRCEKEIQIDPIPVFRRSCGCLYDTEMLAIETVKNKWLLRKANSAHLVEENGRRLIGAVNYASLAQRVHEISIDLGLSCCYLFIFPDPCDRRTSQLLSGTHGDCFYSDKSDKQFNEPFPTNQLLPRALWSKHERFDLLVEPLHFESEIMGYMVVDACLSETWIYESFRTQISGVLKTLLLLENERRYAGRLEAEVGSRTAELEALLHERSEWLRFVAHELRSPLTGIQMTSELIDVKGREISEKELTKYLGRIKRSVDQMGSLVGRLLTLGRIETGHVALNLKETDVSQLVRNLVYEQAVFAAPKGIELRFHGPENRSALVDDELLGHVVVNLISNGIKYSPEQTVVDVTLTMTTETLQIVVADEGQGLTPEDQANLFQRFTPLSAKPTRGEASTGLGLYIVHKLVESMNGQVTVESEGRNRGSRFTVTLPVQPVQM